MAELKKQTLKINGVDTVVYAGGVGEPLLFLHGAGTFHGFEFAKSWADKFHVIHPYHPGFGESGDDAKMDTFNDYVMHYVELLDVLGVEKVHLVGFSLGGFLAAQFASQQSHRIKTLTLIAPAGMRSKEYPIQDVLSLPGEQLVAMLASNFEVLKPWLPAGPDPEFMGARYRETTTVARLLWEKPWDQKFLRYLHRIAAPTLIVWGDEDKLIPVQHADLWKKAIGGARVQIFKGAGHLVLDEKPEAAAAVAAFVGAPLSAAA
jgi:pimeloyl-ACP methyl ester carboxylesterase